ncbi:Lipase 3 [Camponotus floridanus]|uniref:Lipase 3 n=1 Tax=Camponotus floridanus TaxID=104421 RepID=E2AV27_CAMFO|nr:Lipase 3 [Camponotus floridanus]
MTLVRHGRRGRWQDKRVVLRQRGVSYRTPQRVPIALFYADNDWLIDTEDVKRLYHLLPNVVDMYDVPWSKFNHFDFMWAKDASKLVYDRIIKIMRRENPNNITSVE